MMIQPIENALNFFWNFFGLLPFSVKAFIGLAAVLFAVAALVKLLYHAR